MSWVLDTKQRGSTFGARRRESNLRPNGARKSRVLEPKREGSISGARRREANMRLMGGGRRSWGPNE